MSERGCLYYCLMIGRGVRAVPIFGTGWLASDWWVSWTDLVVDSSRSDCFIVIRNCFYQTRVFVDWPSSFSRITRIHPITFYLYRKSKTGKGSKCGDEIRTLTFAPRVRELDRWSFVSLLATLNGSGAGIGMFVYLFCLNEDRTLFLTPSCLFLIQERFITLRNRVLHWELSSCLANLVLSNKNVHYRVRMNSPLILILS